MSESFSFDLFLSHSAKDKTVVRALAKRLRADGLKVWFDEWEIKPGDSIPAKIEEGLEHARVLVLCMFMLDLICCCCAGLRAAKAPCGSFCGIRGNPQCGTHNTCHNKNPRVIPRRYESTPTKRGHKYFRARGEV